MGKEHGEAYAYRLQGEKQPWRYFNDPACLACHCNLLLCRQEQGEYSMPPFDTSKWRFLPLHAERTGKCHHLPDGSAQPGEVIDTPHEGFIILPDTSIWR